MPTLRDYDWFHWIKYGPGTDCTPSQPDSAKQSYTTATVGDTAATQMLGSYNWFVAMGAPAVDQYVYYDGDCYQYKGFTTGTSASSGIVYSAVSPGSPPSNAATCTNCWSLASGNTNYHTWQECGTSTQSIGLMTTGTISSGSNTTFFTNMGSPSVSGTSISRLASRAGTCYEYLGTSTDTTLPKIILQTTDFAIAAQMFDAGQCDACQNGADEYHEWEECGTTAPPCDNGMDVAFVIDYTSSMGPAIENVKTGAAAIAAQVQSLVGTNDYQLGITLADEYHETYSGSTTPPYLTLTDYTSLPANQKVVINTTTPSPGNVGGLRTHYHTNVEKFSLNNETSFTSQLNKLNTAAFPLGNAGYHNFPEPTDPAVEMVGLAAFSGTWRSGVARYIVLMTDTLPTGTDDHFDATDTAALAAMAISLTAQSIKVIVLGPGVNSQSPMSVYPWRVFADATGGTWDEAAGGDYSTATITALSTLCGGVTTSGGIVSNLVGTGLSNTASNNQALFNNVASITADDVVTFNGVCYKYIQSNSVPYGAFTQIPITPVGSIITGNADNCDPCLNPAIPGCMDPVATNYNSLATTDDGSCTYIGGCMDSNASNYSAAATTDDGSCIYCVYGCNDPTATNYNAAATCDDGSCSVVEGGTDCGILFGTEECQPDETSTVTIDLSEGAGLTNIITTVDGSTFGTPTTCTAPATIDVTGLTEGQIINVQAECSYAKEDFNHASGGQSPLWANAECGNESSTTTSFSADTDVYVWYDTSSWGVTQVISSYNAVEDWLADQTANNGWTGNVYHILACDERFLDWANYPMSGNMSLVGGNSFGVACTASGSTSFQAGKNFPKCAAWITHNNIPNWYHGTNQLQNGTGNNSVTKNAAGGSISSVNVNHTMLNKATCIFNAGVGYTGPSTFAGTGNNGLGALPPVMAAGGNFLNILFIDEVTDYSTGAAANTQYGNPPSSGGYTTSSTTNQSTASTYKAELQVKPNWIIHYNNYVTSWKAYDAGGGSGRSFIYPTYPASVSAQHYGMSQLAAAMVFSGNKTTPDGHFTNGTANSLHPVDSSSYGKIDFFEDGTQGARHNVFWDKSNATHPAYGYGGLDNYGWGANVFADQSQFTANVFENDLTTFLSSGPPIITVTNTCTDQQCIFIKAVDESGIPIINYPITVNGVSAGFTDAAGLVTETLSGPGSVVVNGCYTFAAVGSCFQTLITIEVTAAQFTTVLNCVLGCTDPESWSYNPLAGIDDGSCMFPLDEEPFVSRCDQLKIDTECKFATDIFNLYKHHRYGLDKGCLYNIDGHATKKYSSDWTDNLVLDYGAEIFNKKLHTKDATPTPDWVVTACGEQEDPLTIYFYYDCTSLSQQKVTLARDANQEWVDTIKAQRAASAINQAENNCTSNVNNSAPGHCQSTQSSTIEDDKNNSITVYHTLVSGERWIDWGTSAMTGEFNNNGEFDNKYCGGYDSPSGQHLTGNGLIDAVIPDSHNTVHFWSTLMYDTPTRIWYNAGGASYGCTTCTGNTTASGYNGQVYSGTLNGEAPLPLTDNVLVVAFADESGSSGSSPSKNYHYNGSSNTPTWTNAMNGSSETSSTCYRNDYDKFISVYNNWKGASSDRNINLFLYPSKPTVISNPHKPFPLHALGAISSGNKTVKDGTWTAAPVNYLPVTLSAVASSNPYYAETNSTTTHSGIDVATGLIRVNSGYGGLDQYGWGTNVAEQAFTSSGFATDLNAFWDSTVCNDTECILIRVEDKEGVPIPDYEVNLDGSNVGKTNDLGVLRTCVANASINTDHKINLCHCFNTTGGCNQQKLTITVDGLNCDDCGNIKMF